MYNSSKIFQRGSRTYYYSSIFFPPSVKEDVFTLYAFVRSIDDLVDCKIQKTNEYYKFKKDFYQALDGKQIENEIVSEFVKLYKKRKFEPRWVDAFFRSMEMDLEDKKYENLEEVEKYIEGSAEVVGLMMCKILELDETFFDAAKNMARAMQYINFIRDIKEDNELGREYLPKEALRKHGIENLKFEEIKNKEKQFKNFMMEQVQVYMNYYHKSVEKLDKIPKRYRIPIKTAADMYLWTASEIQKDPLIVYKKKVKPSITRIMLSIAYNSAGI